MEKTKTQPENKATPTSKNSVARSAEGGFRGTVLKGTVVSDKMAKTIVVEVTRFVKNQKYQKFVKVTKRYKAHDETNAHKVGETVEIRECRPMSRDKNFMVI